MDVGKSPDQSLQKLTQMPSQTHKWMFNTAKAQTLQDALMFSTEKKKAAKGAIKQIKPPLASKGSMVCSTPQQTSNKMMLD